MMLIFVASLPSSMPAISGPDDLDGLIKVIDFGISTLNYAVIVPAIAYLFVLIARTMGGKFFPVLKTDRAGAILAIAGGLLFTVLMGVLGGSPISFMLIVNGILVGFWSAGIHVVPKKIISNK